MNVGGTLEAMNREEKNRDRCADEERPMQTSEGGRRRETPDFSSGRMRGKGKREKRKGGVWEGRSPVCRSVRGREKEEGTFSPHRSPFSDAKRTKITLGL